jgi:hypothetical protein
LNIGETRKRRGDMSKKLIVWLIAVALILGCLSFVSGEEPKSTTGGGIYIPEIPLPPEETPLPPEETPPPKADDREEPEKASQEEQEYPDGEELEPEEEPEEELTEEDAPEEQTPEEAPVLHVTVPQTLDFIIDPFETARRGQVYSDARVIENRGDTDVLLTFSDISVIFENGSDIEAMRAPFDVYNYTGAARKALYLLLDFGRGDTAPLVLTDEAARANPKGILLHAAGSEGAACALSLSGIVNCDTNAGWRDGDVKISLNYFMEVIPLPAAPEPETPGEEKDDATDATYQGGS